MALKDLPYRLGFTSATGQQELVEAQRVGTFPEWLQGSLIRNGPGSWDVSPGQRVNHWFDGFAMLHLFRIGTGRVDYCNRFLRTPDREEALKQGKISRPGFGGDPCRSLFKKVMSMFVSELGANANINVTRLGERFIAMTETPLAVEFDPQTLETLGLFDYAADGLGGQLTSAHPIHGSDGLYNFTVKMGAQSRYCGYRVEKGGVQRQLFASHPVKEPGYLHSCGLTERELVLLEGPLLVNPLHLLWRNAPYIECYRWKPERGSRLILMNRQDGSCRVAEGPPMFVFHHVNSFYQGQELCVDVLAYDDPTIISSLYFAALEDGRGVPAPLLKRLRVQGSKFVVETLCQTGLELPRIDDSYQGRDYPYVYGVTRIDSPFYNGLTRVETVSGETLNWCQPGCFAGEPVYVSSGTGAAVILSAVLDSQRSQSFLLCLDSETFQELARAYVPAVVPFGFHGGFY